MGATQLLRHLINSDEREKYIKINNAAYKALEFFGKRYPNPADYLVQYPNTKRLQEILVKYNEYEGMGRRKTVINWLVRIIIDKMEHSPNWRDVFGWWIDRLREGPWHECSYNHPVNGWNEPKPYGRQTEW